MLASAGLGDNALFAHTLYQKTLTKDIVDLVCPGMIQIFSFEPDLSATELFRQAAQWSQGGRTTAEFLGQGDVLLPEACVLAQTEE